MRAAKQSPCAANLRSGVRSCPVPARPCAVSAERTTTLDSRRQARDRSLSTSGIHAARRPAMSTTAVRKENVYFDHCASGGLQHVGGGAVAANEDHPLVGRRGSRRHHIHASHLPHPSTGCTPAAQTLPTAVRLPRARPHGSRNRQTMKLIALLTHAESALGATINGVESSEFRIRQ